MRLGLAFMVAALALASNSAAATARQPNLARRQRGDLAIQARAILKKYCSECHKPDSAPFDIMNFKELTSKDHPVPLVSIETPRSQIIELIEDGSMPPGGRAKRPTGLEIATLKKWLAARSPSFPRAFDEPYVGSVIEADRSSRKSESVRYLSLAHLVREGSDFHSLQEQEKRLQQALEAGTTKARAASASLQPLDDAATVFRIDLAQLGWDAKDLFDEIGVRGEIKGVPKGMTPFDLILLENPFRAMGAAGMWRQVPYLRGDWLAAAMAPGSPLAADMQSMVELSEAKEGKEPCGPRNRAFEKAQASSGGNPPITSWYGGDRANPFEVAFKLSLPEAAVKVNQNFHFDLKPGRAGQFRLLNVLSDGELRIVPIEQNLVRKDEAFKLGPNSMGSFKITSILSGAAEAKEHFILLFAEGSMPLPTIVRSRHNTLDCPKDRAPVYRFFFDKGPENWSPDKVVRKVITLTVKAK